MSEETATVEDRIRGLEIKIRELQDWIRNTEYQEMLRQKKKYDDMLDKAGKIEKEKQ